MTKQARTVPDGYRLQGGAAIPTRPKTLAEVQRGIAQDKKRDPEIAKSMARLMLKHGWLADDARAWLSQEYPQ